MAKRYFKTLRPEQLKLDGEYTRLLKAYAQLLGLVHSVKCGNSFLGVGVEVEVYVKTKWYESTIDVFKEGQVAYVSSMREYTQNADENTVEEFSKKILEGTFGEKRYLMSMKGGDCYTIMPDRTLEFTPRYKRKDLPRSLEELQLRLAAAGIDVDQCTV